MPEFEIEQYELHTAKYRVDAESEAEAIFKLFDGDVGRTRPAMRTAPPCRARRIAGRVLRQHDIKNLSENL